MSDHEQQLPLGDRTDESVPRRRDGETALQYVDRLAREFHGLTIPAETPRPAAARPGRLTPEERIDAIARGEDPDAREPGADG